MRVVGAGIPPLIDLEARPLPPGPPWRLLFFGFVRPYKGLEVAIDAVAELLRRGMPVELTIAGMFWGPVDPWRERVAARDLDGTVSLRPAYVPDREVQDLLSWSHIVIAPYRSAPQSAIVPLAYAAGRPVVATNVGGLSEQVLEGVTGALAPPEDPAAFADAVERVIAGLQSLAKSTSEHTPTWDTVVEGITRLAADRQANGRRR
jgi:glycosyltransferase involved in cell wall biosynthesis